MTAMRQARVFDGGSPGGQARPAVPEAVAGALLTYLTGAPIVLAARGFDKDVIDPAGPRDVPMTFHTDGTWIWSGAVGYYLRVHGIPPEPDLVDHIRARAFRIPDVPDDVRSSAVDIITGAASAPQPAAGPVDEPVAEPRAEPATEPAKNEPAGEPAEPVDPAPTVAAPTVATPTVAQPVPPVPPAQPMPPVPPALADHGGPIAPLPGEPPVTLYQGLRQVVLPAGARIDRFGTTDGNVTYAAGTHYGQRSLPPEWTDREYHVYQVVRPIRALAGVAIAWFGQPGGGTAYILPGAISAHLADGTLIETSAP